MKINSISWSEWCDILRQYVDATLELPMVTPTPWVSAADGMAGFLGLKSWHKPVGSLRGGLIFSKCKSIESELLNSPNLLITLDEFLLNLFRIIDFFKNSTDSVKVEFTISTAADISFTDGIWNSTFSSSVLIYFPQSYLKNLLKIYLKKHFINRICFTLIGKCLEKNSLSFS